MKERRKVKVEEEQKKTYYILHLEYSWIREFVKIGIFYTKKRVNVFRLIPIPRECIGKNQKNIVRRRRVKERKIMFKNREKIKRTNKKNKERIITFFTLFFSLDYSHILIFPFFHSRTILIETKKENREITRKKIFVKSQQEKSVKSQDGRRI